MLRKILHNHRLVALVLVGITLVGTQIGSVRRFVPLLDLEGVLLDTRYALRPSQPAHPSIQLIGVEASTLQLDRLSQAEMEKSEALQLMSRPWPWDRRVFAQAIRKILEAGARVLVLDFVFAGDNAGNEALANVIREHPDKVVIASMFDYPSDGQSIQYVVPEKVLEGLDVYLLTGFATVWSEVDDVVRKGRFRTSLMEELGQTPDPKHEVHALSLQAFTRFTGRTNSPPDGAYIDFRALPGAYRVIPFENLFVDQLWRDPKGLANGSVFRDKIVILGPMAEILKDVHRTPMGPMKGPELQANLTATLLQHSELRDLPRGWGFALEAGLLVGALWICLKVQRVVLKGVFLLLVLGSYLVFCQALFQHRLVVFMAPSVIGFTFAGGSVLLLQFALEQFERLRIRGYLDRYVSRNVAHLILQDQRPLRESFHGKRQTVTVLFSDIRGFTTMTEASQAQELVAQLNEYFQPMVEIILREEGTLQKFIGDAIMAVWGDTHSLGPAEDARRAVRSALAMRRKLQELNHHWQGRCDRRPLAIGIGINHGEVVVGNIGHPQRMEFTVLGDAVNLASRLEGASKAYQLDLLIGESVVALTRQDFVYRSVDLLVVKGKTQPIEVHTALGEKPEPPPAWLKSYHLALQQYRQRQFAEAIESLAKTQQEKGSTDRLCELYLERCRAYGVSPPPPDWIGVYTLKEK